MVCMCPVCCPPDISSLSLAASFFREFLDKGRVLAAPPCGESIMMAW